MRLLKIISIITCLTVITSCGWFKKEKNKQVQSVDVMYNEGLNELQDKSYKKAIEQFEEVESTYPYSEWATKAKIMSAYSSFLSEDYDTALLTLDRFIKLHPGNKDIEYAYYLRALCFYEQISDVERDQSYSSFAKSALQEVVTRFPESKYAQDARLKIDLVNDHLGGKELTVGRFYLKQGNYPAAINRFKNVIEKYSTTSHVAETLHRMVEAYLSLGIRDEAEKYAAVLGYNFPDSKWYKRSYELLEGKKLKAADVSDKKGKWYDFTGWKGLTFKNKAKQRDSEQSDEDNFKADGKPLEPVFIKELPEDGGKVISPLPDEKEVKEEPKKQGIFKRIGGWFKPVKLPFSSDMEEDKEQN